MKSHTLLLFILMLSLQHFGQDCQQRKNRNPFLRASADASRSDSLDVLHIDLNIDMTHWNDQELFGVAEIDLISKVDDVQRVLFDLLAMQVDSVKINGSLVDFVYESPLLICYADVPFNTDDAFSTQLFYHGSPVTDDSGWGGFYWQNDFAFNLGVGFDADPHNYGRAWFPCFDNFVERSTYALHVLTSDARTSYCGGTLASVTALEGDSLISDWYIDQPIPSYLASIAVGDYVHVTQQFQSISGEEIPIWLAAESSDTTNLINSFANLIPCLDRFEFVYGPYEWPRVGYVLVPFSSGAMEHAMNIAYPQYAANGGLGNQTLMAHELAHHWWGDFVTCSSQEDMWINEGMASYSEALFIESISGEEAYKAYVRDNHKDVLLYAHRRDGERLPVSGIGHAYTYGDHVYNKGADVAHTLRGYMQEDFFHALTAFLAAHPNQAVSSEQLRDFLDPLSDADVFNFFEDWIFQPGFPDIRVKKMEVTSEGENTIVNLQIVTFLHYSSHLYSNVPMEIEFVNSTTEERFVTEGLISGAETNLEFSVPFEADMVLLNRSEKINQAVLAEEMMVGDDGIKTFQFGEFRIDVNAIDISDSLWIRVENHWSRADLNNGQSGIHLADDRFWRIHCAQNVSEYDIEGRIRMYGDESATNYFDPLFFAAMQAENMNEDSLHLFHRSSPDADWVEVLGMELNTQGPNMNGVCYMDFPLMSPGDYAWGFYSDVVSVNSAAQHKALSIYPNPVQDNLQILNLDAPAGYKVFDRAGQLVQEGRTTGTLLVGSLSPGAYLLKIDGKTFPFVKM